MKLPPHHGSAACTETRLPAGLDLLLVEDQMLIAMDAEAILADAGIGRVVTACSVADALEHIRASLPDVAVLDVNLGAGTSIPIAEELARRGVPFVFTTGYSDGTDIPGDFRTRPVVCKPYGAAALVEAITGALSGSSAV